MKSIYQKLLKSRAINFLSSLELSVVCLSLLAILTFWGTLYQAEYGLYAAQQKFFRSWIFISAGFIPFPGTRLVLWVFTINLITSVLFKQSHAWSNFGILLTHYGIILLMVGGFVTFHFAKESQVTLKEGASTSLSADYIDWEISIWQSHNPSRDVTAVWTGPSLEGTSISLPELGLDLTIQKYLVNCDAFTASRSDENSLNMNSSGIQSLKEKSPDVEPAKNTPGVIFTVLSHEGKKSGILLYAQDPNPTIVSISGESYMFQLRHRRYPLPLHIRLKDFRMTKYPGVEKAKSYESTVEIDTGQIKRDVVISMNRPFRFDHHTFYQASYMIASDGSEYSTFAVVRNVGRLIPYIAILLTGLGLVNHFLIKLVLAMRKNRSQRKKR